MFGYFIDRPGLVFGLVVVLFVAVALMLVCRRRWFLSHVPEIAIVAVILAVLFVAWQGSLGGSVSTILSTVGTPTPH